MLKLIFKLFGILMLGAVATGANRAKSRDTWPAGATDSDMANVPAQPTGGHDAESLLALKAPTGEHPRGGYAATDVPAGGHIDYAPKWASDTRPVRTDPAALPRPLILRASVDAPGQPGAYAISAEGSPDFLRALSGAFLSTVAQFEAERR